MNLGSQARAPFRYPEAKCGTAHLRNVRGVPVLFVNGTPEEIGEQAAILGVKPAREILDYPMDLLKQRLPVGRILRRIVWKRVLQKGELLLRNFPQPHRQEFEAMAAAGIDRNRLLAANTMFDLKNLGLLGLFGCSSLIVDAERSMTGQPLFGRNLDFFPCGCLHELTLVTVCRALGKRGFVSVGFPGIVGCFSGMNESGLAVASHDVFTRTRDRKFDPEGIPFALCCRRLLEECDHVAEAYKLLEKMKRTTSTILAICDKAGGAVLEATPDRLVMRNAARGFCACTNHFIAQALAARVQLNTYRTVDRLGNLENFADRERLGIAEMLTRLYSASQGELTLQTMIFEPASLKLHLALGGAPATPWPASGDLEPGGLSSGRSLARGWLPSEADGRTPQSAPQGSRLGPAFVRHLETLDLASLLL